MDFMGPANALNANIDKFQSQIPDPMDQAMKRARLQQMQEAHAFERQRAKNLQFETKMTLWEKLGHELPDGGVDLLNGALADIDAGFEVSPEMVKQGGKFITLAAEALHAGNNEQAQMILGMGMDRKVFKSATDASEFARLQDLAAKRRAEDAAKTLVPVPDYLTAAKQRIEEYHKGNGKYVYGDNPNEHVEAVARDQFVLDQGAKELGEQERVKTMLSMNPALTNKALESGFAQATNPTEVARRQMRQFLARYDELAPEERKQLDALTLVYGDAATQQAIGIKTAAAEARAAQHELADLSNRRQMFEAAFTNQGAAQADAQDILGGLTRYRGGLGAAPNIEEITQAKVELNGLNERLTGAEQAYRQATAGAAQLTAQQAQEAKQKAEQLRKQVTRGFGDTEQMSQRADEAQKIAVSSEAAHRLLTDLSPYALARQEAQVAMLESEVADRKASGATMDDMDTQLEATRAQLAESQRMQREAQGAVQAEQLRMLSREQRMTARLTEAQRKEQREARLVDATSVAHERILNGESENRVLVEVSKQSGLPIKDLREQIAPGLEPLRLSRAQQDMGTAYVAFEAKHKREPTQAELVGLRNTVMKRHPTVDAADVMKGLVKAPLVDINMKQETAESARVGDTFGKQYGALQEAGMEAANTLARLDRMAQLLDGVATGTLTPAMTQIQGVANSLGLTVDKTLPAKQALEALSNEIALQLRNPSGGAGMPGALSDRDLQFLTAMTPNLSKTPEGNRLIIDTARALAKRSQEVAKMARAYRKANGHFDEGFLDELQAYGEAHPLFAGKALPNSAAPGPYADPEKEARYQEWKKRQGR